MPLYPFPTFDQRQFLLWNLAQPINNRISADNAAFDIKRYALWNQIQAELEPVRAKQRESQLRA